MSRTTEEQRPDLVSVGADSVSVREAIWRENFGLTGEPFALTPDPAFLFLSDPHAEALAGLKLGLIERRGLLVLVGEVGTGKTTIVYTLLSGLDRRVETAYISNTALPFEEMLQAALKDLGVEAPSTQGLELLEALNGFLESCAEQDKTVALVIDEAQNLTDRTFERLRLLLNFETYKEKLLQIVLVGQPELGDRLGQHRLRQVADRIAIHSTLRPLNASDSRLYVDHRLKAVGGSRHVFTRPALSLLVRKSRGIPRRINILGHNAMILAYGQGESTVRRGMVHHAARNTTRRGFLRARRGSALLLRQ